MTPPPAAAHPIRVGVSSCLLGEAVRYDGGHKRDRFLTDLLGRYVEWVPVCPELESGLGVPRPAMRLEREGRAVRLREIGSGRDHTARMQRFAARRLRALRPLELCGYVLKKGSPSCGVARVKVHRSNGTAAANGRGLFAEVLMEAFPLLPVEEEGRLNDPQLRENFIERVFAYHRLRSLFAERWTLAALVAFHTAHKLQLMAHSPAGYRELGRLVATAGQVARAQLRDRYASEFMTALACLATRRRHVNVLHHILGYLRPHLDADSRRELLALIDDYGAELVPLVVPLTLIRHHVRRLTIPYLQGQLYLEPHPKELMLRNHV